MNRYNRVKKYIEISDLYNKYEKEGIFSKIHGCSVRLSNYEITLKHIHLNNSNLLSEGELIDLIRFKQIINQLTIELTDNKF